MTGTIRPYAWGSPTFIPRLLGTEPTDEPQAELWLGAHASGSATVGDQPLDEMIAADPAGVVGAASVEEFGEVLPYLLKVLAIAKPLSLQAHPSRAQAEEGYAREEAAGTALDAKSRLYKDTWPKPEMLCALVDSEALCGFRDPEATYDLFGQLGVAAATALVAPLVNVALTPDRRLAAVFASLLRLAGDELSVVADVVAAARAIDVEGDLGLFAQTARQLGEDYGDDPGLLAALLMNRVTLQPKQAVFLPAGNLHAYLDGAGVEIMANSDNVMRGGLTPKHVDVDELLAILDFTPGFPGYIDPVEESPGLLALPDARTRVRAVAAGATRDRRRRPRVVVRPNPAGHRRLGRRRGRRERPPAPPGPERLRRRRGRTRGQRPRHRLRRRPRFGCPLSLLKASTRPELVEGLDAP